MVTPNGKRKIRKREKDLLAWHARNKVEPLKKVPMGPPSGGGDVAVKCQRHKPTELAHSFFFYSVLVSISVFMALSTVFHSLNSPDNSPLSHCSSSLISAVLVLLTIYLFMKVSISPGIILCG